MFTVNLWQSTICPSFEVEPGRANWLSVILFMWERSGQLWAGVVRHDDHPRQLEVRQFLLEIKIMTSSMFCPDLVYSWYGRPRRLLYPQLYHQSQWMKVLNSQDWKNLKRAKFISISLIVSDNLSTSFT